MGLAARGKKRAKRRAVVAEARKLAVVLHGDVEEQRSLEALSQRGTGRDNCSNRGCGPLDFSSGTLALTGIARPKDFC